MNSNRVMVDWLSFTVMIDIPDNTPVHTMFDVINSRMTDVFGYGWITLVTNHPEWSPERGRPPYSQSLKLDGISIYFNVKLNNFLVEITGHGCEILRELDLLKLFILKARDRITRVDIAVDLLNDVRPSEFVGEALAGRFKSRSHIISKDGETQYLGSMKSERYCRVYRYDEPHPRASMLRCEFVFRKKNAKICVDKIIEADFKLIPVALGCGKIFGFEHEAWDLSGDEIEIGSYTPDRGHNKTLFWLVSSVGPAFRKLVDAGVIEDPKAWLSEYFLNETMPSEYYDDPDKLPF